MQEENITSAPAADGASTVAAHLVPDQTAATTTGPLLLSPPTPASVTDHCSNASSSSTSASASASSSSLPKLCSSSDSAADDLSLHQAVFNNDANKIYEILNNNNIGGNNNNKEAPASGSGSQLVNKKDKHGNTPLHLACMLGRPKEVVGALLQSGASVDCKNLNRWTPFHEACSYGNREVIGLLTKQLENDVYDTINKNKLAENLEKTKNYRLVLKWEFQSWVPLLTRVLPRDVCVITKQGKYIRIDTRLLDFEMLAWKRNGDSCLIYSDQFEKKWVILNNITKKYQHFETRNLEKDIEDKVDEFMSFDIMDLELKSSDIQLTRSTCGWIWKADKMERVGKFQAALYNFNNVFLVTRKRREHLTESDLKRNKLAYNGALHVLKFGKRPNLRELEEASSQGYDGDDNNNGSDDNNSTTTTNNNNNSSSSNNNKDNDDEDSDQEPEVRHRESLPPPPPTKVTWEQYIQADAGHFPTLGREHKCKVVKTAFKASVAMSQEFPITKNEFLDLLSIVPLRLFKKLKEFIEMRFPEGFPVRLDVPVFPFLTARITFEDFTFIEGPIDESLFRVPDDYQEDPNLFPLLSGRSRGNSS